MSSPTLRILLEHWNPKLKPGEFQYIEQVFNVEEFCRAIDYIIDNHSCCCSGCTKHNIALTTEKQNSEFDDLTDEENKILEETGYLCKVRKLSSPF